MIGVSVSVGAGSQHGLVLVPPPGFVFLVEIEDGVTYYLVEIEDGVTYYLVEPI